MSMFWFWIGNSFVLTVFLILYLWGDTSDSGILGTLSRLCFIQIPQTFMDVVTSIFGKSAANSIYATYDYVVNQKNPLLLIFYMIIINCAFLGWVFAGDPQLPCYLVPTRIHSLGGYIGISLCQISFYFACKIGPGRITPASEMIYDQEVYDGLLFVDGIECKTCGIKKVKFAPLPLISIIKLL